MWPEIETVEDFLEWMDTDLLEGSCHCAQSQDGFEVWFDNGKRFRVSVEDITGKVKTGEM